VVATTSAEKKVYLIIIIFLLREMIFDNANMFIFLDFICT